MNQAPRPFPVMTSPFYFDVIYVLCVGLSEGLTADPVPFGFLQTFYTLI